MMVLVAIHLESAERQIGIRPSSKVRRTDVIGGSRVVAVAARVTAHCARSLLIARVVTLLNARARTYCLLLA